ncbi:arylsulfatase [Lutibacter citreus]|uniref:arylsulfatase n=1 Tax=Lutibacter citreus TaxID=2138210 RepID=UPI000DBE4CED|nr:arylsulfatase [Lutibacter citreus]
MKNIYFNKLILLSLLVMILISCVDKTKQIKKSKPNVIVLVSDDQGYGDIAFLGNPSLKTPNLDKLAEQSIRFTDFHVSSICTPSRSQLLTGVDAVRNGAYNYGFGKNNIFHSYPDIEGNEHEIHLMPEFFKANGYRTGHFGKWHLGDFYPFRSMDRGFDETFTFPGAAVWQTPNQWNNDCFDDVYLRNGKPEKTEGYCTDVWFSESINFIEKSVKDDEPFFVYLPTSAMHTPQYVPAKYMEPYKDFPPLVAQFFGMIANFDENLGRLDSVLDNLKIKDNTILLYMSDNGGTLGVQHYNAGMKGKKCSVYDGGHRVPFFMRWPNGIKSTNRDITDLTVVQDVLPTLIDLCDLKMPWKQNFDGVNLSNLIKDESLDLSGRMSVVQFSTKRVGLNGYSVLWNKWRLVDGMKLYNFENDPGQKNNVAKKYPEVLKKMQDYYVSWRTSVEPSLAKNSQIDIGYPAFESIELTSFDWLELEGKGDPSQQIDIRLGMEMHGSWNINVVENGTYELTFRRWPKEVDVAINSGLPAHFTEFAKQIGATKIPENGKYHNWRSICPNGIHPEGKALPISKINFIANEKSQIKNISSEDKSVRFVMDLSKGPLKLQGDFLDIKGNILCGAYYVDIVKID